MENELSMDESRRWKTLRRWLQTGVRGDDGLRRMVAMAGDDNRFWIPTSHGGVKVE